MYDGFNLVQERAANGTPIANLPMASAIDEDLVRIDSSGLNTLLADGIGSTIALADAGAVQTQDTFEPFGATTTSAAQSANSFQFTGRENDGAGLNFLGQFLAKHNRPVDAIRAFEHAISVAQDRPADLEFA